MKTILNIYFILINYHACCIVSPVYSSLMPFPRLFILVAPVSRLLTTVDPPSTRCPLPSTRCFACWELTPVASRPSTHSSCPAPRLLTPYCLIPPVYSPQDRSMPRLLCLVGNEALILTYKYYYESKIAI